ncbi:hypothetical protein CB0940_06212 [Cercospora beticola]|uniref:Malic acid transport protein n=1 Tax=Cercospora beticola TaxID=122368 RepID=A0A2G5HX50_CERBT|nr:hypothetical protein CB0940_06212 [Cercospora beticola]PIA97108.1 hypothetical protein CB0940_06212 [Cercospora beticola]
MVHDDNGHRRHSQRPLPCSLPLCRPLCHWLHLLHIEHCPLPVQCHHDLAEILLSSGHIQAFHFTSDRKSVHTSEHHQYRHNTDECLAIWPDARESLRTLAAVDHVCFLLDLLRIGRLRKLWDLFDPVRVLERKFTSRSLLTLMIVLIMQYRWSTQTFTVAQMTPVWIFPCYPLLVIGPHAAGLAEHLSEMSRPEWAVNVIVGGFVFQGIGFLLSLMIYAAFIYRLMTQKLPAENLRPGMFVSVGPSGFTISGVVGMGDILPRVVDQDFLLPGHGELAGQVSKIASVWFGLWLWGLAFWFFIVSVGAHWNCIQRGRMTFAMTFYSYVFPQTALTTATFYIALALDNRPIRILGCAMAILVIIAWIVVFVMMIRAVINKDILWPQKQEDKDEGGWSANGSDGRPICDVVQCTAVGPDQSQGAAETAHVTFRTPDDRSPTISRAVTIDVESGAEDFARHPPLMRGRTRQADLPVGIV